MVLELRLRKLSPSLLHQKLKANEKVAVIDLLNFEDGENLAGIPGAIRVDPKRLRSRTHVVIPEDLEVVLYCSSARALTSARVALSLRKKGIPRVWILDGGLAAWQEQGLPVSPVPIPTPGRCRAAWHPHSGRRRSSPNHDEATVSNTSKILPSNNVVSEQLEQGQ